MGPEVIFYSLAILLAFVLAGVHIGVALGLASVIGVYLSYGDINIALSILGSTGSVKVFSTSLKQPFMMRSLSGRRLLICLTLLLLNF